MTQSKPNKVIATYFISLDGIVSYPAWTAPYWNDETEAFKTEEEEGVSAFLLGRNTYEEFAQAWPKSEDPGAPAFNAMRKYVASTTRTEDIWQNATFIAKDVPAEVRRLKQRGAGHLLIHGSVTLTRSLLAEGLIDELRLLVYPVIVGEGLRLLDGVQPGDLDLVSSRTTSKGVVGLVYRPKETRA